VVDQFTDLFRTTHKVKTQQVVKNRGQYCGDIELAGYLANAAGPVPLVLDLRIAHDRFGSSSNPDLNGKLHRSTDMDKSLNEAVADNIVNLSEFYSYRLIGKLTGFLQLQEFSQRNQIWDHSSTFTTRLSFGCLNHASHRFSPKLRLYVLILT
jgi:hypothetical protein